MIATSQTPSPDSSASDSCRSRRGGELAGRSPVREWLQARASLPDLRLRSTFRSLREPANLFFVVTFPVK